MEVQRAARWLLAACHDVDPITDDQRASIDALATLVPPAVVEALAAKRGDRGNPIGRLARDGLAE